MRSGSQDQSVDVFVEIPRGSRTKYEMVVVEEPTFPGCVVPSRPIGTLLMHDEHGDDEKILAVPVGDPRFDEVRADKSSEVKGWHDADVAWRLIGDARDRARRNT